jgi:teichuronic acid biosynthesis glycosyltransferase TuaH
LVYCAGTAWDGNRGTDQHLAAALADRSPVLFVDPPSSILDHHRDSLRSPFARLEIVRPGLAHLTPYVLPGRTRGLVRATTGWIMRRAMRRAVRTLGVDAEFVVAANLWPVFGACGERRRVLFVTDDWPAGASLMGLSETWVRQRERALVESADTVVAVSDPLADTLRARGAANVAVVENGVDVEAFARCDRAQWPSDLTIQHPAAGLIGHLSDRIDIELLEVTAARGCPLLLVGPRAGGFGAGRLERLLSLPNVQWVGPKPFDELPSYMRTIGVGLLPYRDTVFNRSSFPLKVLEYLAAGRPVVATDLPAIRRLDGAAIRVARDAELFANEVERALAELPGDGSIDAGRVIASRRSWAAVADQFCGAIEFS